MYVSVPLVSNLVNSVSISRYTLVFSLSHNTDTQLLSGTILTGNSTRHFLLWRIDSTPLHRVMSGFPPGSPYVHVLRLPPARTEKRPRVAVHYGCTSQCILNGQGNTIYSFGSLSVLQCRVWVNTDGGVGTDIQWSVGTGSFENMWVERFDMGNYLFRDGGRRWRI